MLHHMNRAAAGRVAKPPNFIASSTNSTAGTFTTLTITTPTGTQSGDLLLAFLTVGNVTLTPPAGWTLSRSITDTTANSVLGVYYIFLASAPAASYVFTASSATSWAGSLLTYRGYTTINDSAIQVNAASASQIIAPSVTAGGSGGVLLCCFSRDDSASAITVPSGMTERSSSIGGAGSTRLHKTADLGVVSGATGTKIASVPSGSVTSIGFSMAFS
jgi:hypothetical protein